MSSNIILSIEFVFFKTPEKLQFNCDGKEKIRILQPIKKGHFFEVPFSMIN
jgi:hypothetical protein